jgi:hypothetical protein
MCGSTSSKATASGYRSRQILKPGQDVPVIVAGNELGRIAVAGILPRRP